MAVDLTPDLTDDLWAAIRPHLPPRPRDRNPRGGRPTCDDRVCLRGIVYLLREGCRWQRIPSAALGCPSGSTYWRRFRAWTAAGVWGKAHLQLLDPLGEAGVLDLERVVVDSASVRAEKGGPRRPQPDRPGQGGGKRHTPTDAGGVPLVVRTGPANARDDTLLEGLLEAFPVLTDGDRYATVHVLPKALLGDRGYGFPYLIAAVEMYGIESTLSPRWKDKPRGSGPGSSGRWRGGTTSAGSTGATSGPPRTSRGSTSWPPASYVRTSSEWQPVAGCETAS